MITEPGTIEKVIRNRYVQHGLFWLISFYILYRVFAYSTTVEWVDVIYTFLFHIALVAVVYINLRWLIPLFLEKGKYLFYTTSIAGLILLGITINFTIFNGLSDWLFPGFYFIDYYDFFDLLEFISAYLLITSLFKFSKSWFRQKEAAQRITKLEKDKLNTEINALKNQINPHFLFNALNNLYSLSLDKDEKVPGVVLKLSEMMRYLLYETNVDKISLKKEIEHLNNYIDLQNIRIESGRSIQLIVNDFSANISIVPLLFLPLVENVFKHGDLNENIMNDTRIDLTVNETEIIFSTKNKIGEKDDFLQNKNGGVGLINLNKRLKLLYQEQYYFKAYAEGAYYFTRLKIYR